MAQEEAAGGQRPKTASGDTFPGVGQKETRTGVDMRFGVGYSENADTVMAGKQAAGAALKEGGRRQPCDLVLLFATARHDPHRLRSAVAGVLGPRALIIGGATVGGITNTRFGYAGNQVILAAVWLDKVKFEILTQNGLNQGEEEAGLLLGQKLAAAGATSSSSIMLFYDSVNRSQGDMRLIMATPLLQGLERGLGCLPPALVGAGLQGDYEWSATWQWTGRDLDQHSASALIFSGDIRLDTVILHGCHPATDYYTVTKADRQVILEINGRPALRFLDKILGDFVRTEDYPFFLILGVNREDKWAPFVEENYANNLCLGLDTERQGLVMFEPGMAQGTEFQIMHRSLSMDYIPPRVAALFDRLDGRRPVFATYINCAGRAAGQAGLDTEDAAIIQREIAGRVPLLGLYTGVEIAAVKGRPQGLDWTGVLTLFSVAS
jgi:hypothetical protein